MRLTIAQMPDKIEEFEVGESLQLGDLRALVELNFEIPRERQRLLYNGQPLHDDNKTLSDLAISDNAMIYVADSHQQQQQQQQQQRRHASAGNAPAHSLTPQQSAQMEAHRQRVLRNPELMAQLRQTHPDIANAIQHNPQEFLRLMGVLQQQQQQIQSHRQQELANLEADPFNIESQRRIEEMIQEENIMRNMETALELNPESFATVTMLFIDVIVNGTPIKALVDSGAQATVMSHSCAERCGIMRLVDKRFAGEARGVGRAKILGRVHNAEMQLGGMTLLCSFTVMEGAHISLLFGLDMLKRHLACIDLKRNALVIGDNVIEFLPEHLIPKDLDDDNPAKQPIPSQSSAPIATITPPAPVPVVAGAPMGSADASNIAQRQNYLQSQQIQSQQSSLQQFNQPAPPSTRIPPASGSQPRFPEHHIKALMDLGVSRDEAIRHLEAAGGNLDIAASLIFS